MKRGNIIAMAATLSACAAFISCGSKQENEKETPFVRIEKVSNSGELTPVSYPGRTKAEEEMNLAFRISGPIAKFHVKEGDKVTRGQLIAEMDPRDYQVQLDATRAEYEQIKADAERVIAMYREGNTTASNYDKARYGLQQITEKLRNHKNQLNDTKLYAPAGGYIQSRLHEAGETVGAGMPVVSMFSDSGVEVEIYMPAADFTNRDGIEGYSCSFDILPGETFPLEMSRVSQEANASQLYAVRLRIKNGHDASKITPGMSTMVYASIKTNDSSETVSIPSNAVVNDKGRTMVFVYDEGKGCVKSRSVTIGALHTDGSTDITSGLRHGENVVTAGMNQLKDGDRVKPLPQPTKSNVGGLM